MSKTNWIISAALLAVAPLPLVAQTTPPAAQQAPADWRETYAYTVGMQAVIYGFPVVKNITVRLWHDRKAQWPGGYAAQHLVPFAPRLGCDR